MGTWRISNGRIVRSAAERGYQGRSGTGRIVQTRKKGNLVELEREPTAGSRLLRIITYQTSFYSGEESEGTPGVVIRRGYREPTVAAGGTEDSFGWTRCPRISVMEKVDQLSGLDLSRAVAEAVGWGDLSTMVSEQLPKHFSPHSSADDALKALEVMNARGWRVHRCLQPYKDKWFVEMKNVELRLIAIGEAREIQNALQGFAQALSRALVAARESEGK